MAAKGTRLPWAWPAAVVAGRNLLMALVERRGAVASRAELLEEVWGYATTDVMTRTVDIHMAELRKKLEEDPARSRHLLTVRKVGYRLEA